MCFRQRLGDADWLLFASACACYPFRSIRVAFRAAIYKEGIPYLCCLLLLSPTSMSNAYIHPPSRESLSPWSNRLEVELRCFMIAPAAKSDDV